MTIFNCNMIDSKTRLPLIAKDASYNRACEYLFSKYGAPQEVKYINVDYTRIIYPSRAFIYDEKRGYLLESND